MTIEATIASMGSKATYTGAGVTIAVAVQVAFGLWLGDWFAGAARAGEVAATVAGGLKP
jgi:hypothetical protein